MTKYGEILRLASLRISQANIAASCNISKKTVNRVLQRAREAGIVWPLSPDMTDEVLAKLLFPPADTVQESDRKMPDFDYVHNELNRNGVSKKLLWTEYLEDCRRTGEKPLMYSQFCYYTQKDEEKRRASMHIQRRPGEQIEVDWAGDPAHIIDRVTGQLLDVYLFVGVLSYSQYAYVEALPNMKTPSWIAAHVHMYQFFGGVSKILVPDNCKTAVTRNRPWDTEPQINEIYHQMAEHYGTAIIPARVRAPKDKANAESVVGNISTWITASLRHEQFFSLLELNTRILEKLTDYNAKPFQKKDGSRLSLFLGEEKLMLKPLPAAPFELAEWKQATVQYNYHIFVDGMYYSVPNEYIKQKVDVRITKNLIEIYSRNIKIASHIRLYGRKGQYSTQTPHMPKEHQEYLEWNGDRFRRWAMKIGENTYTVVDAMLRSKITEQQAYRSCMGLLNLGKRYSDRRLENACRKALSYTSTPSYKAVKDILVTRLDINDADESDQQLLPRGITRGADYYGRK